MVFGDSNWNTKADLILTIQFGSSLCIYELLYYRQTYVITNWNFVTLFDEVNQLQMGIYNIEENDWTITPLFGFSISGGKSYTYFH